GSIYGSKYYPNRKALVRGYLQGGKKFEEEIDCVWDDSQDYYVGSLGFSSFDNGDYQLFLEGWYNNVPLYLRIDAGFHNLISNRENIVNLTDSSLPVGNLKYDDIEPETIEGSDLSLLLGKIRDYDFGQLSQEVIEDFNADYYIDGTDLSLLLSNIFESNTALPGE
ncbi:hypothetical protein ISS86_03060, partial [Candidatus Microgenomates bacterium]|nr:hypothetical protein [Candidatus Microgenomates bacterium]